MARPKCRVANATAHCPGLLELPASPSFWLRHALGTSRSAAQGPNGRLRCGCEAPAKVADAAALDTQAVRNEKLYTFLANDFSEPRWRSAALKNAFALLSKQQHELAAAGAAGLKRRLAALRGRQLSLPVSRKG